MSKIAGKVFIFLGITATLGAGLIVIPTYNGNMHSSSESIHLPEIPVATDTITLKASTSSMIREPLDIDSFETPTITQFELRDFNNVSGGMGVFVWKSRDAKACALYRIVPEVTGLGDGERYEPVLFPLAASGELEVVVETGDYALWCGDLKIIPGNDRPGWGPAGMVSEVVHVLPKSSLPSIQGSL
jgi:hypothetical protein